MSLPESGTVTVMESELELMSSAHAAPTVVLCFSGVMPTTEPYWLNDSP